MLAHDLKDDLNAPTVAPDVQILSLKAFVKRGKRREFDFVGML